MAGPVPLVRATCTPCAWCNTGRRDGPVLNEPLARDTTRSSAALDFRVPPRRALSTARSRTSTTASAGSWRTRRVHRRADRVVVSGLLQRRPPERAARRVSERRRFATLGAAGGLAVPDVTVRFDVMMQQRDRPAGRFPTSRPLRTRQPYPDVADFGCCAVPRAVSPFETAVRRALPWPGSRHRVRGDPAPRALSTRRLGRRPSAPAACSLQRSGSPTRVGRAGALEAISEGATEGFVNRQPYSEAARTSIDPHHRVHPQ